MLHLYCGVQRGWLPLVLCLSLILPFTNSQDSGPASVTLTTSSVTFKVATETIDISSALAVAASVAPTLALGKFSNPIPLPTDAPTYKDISQLAAGFSPLEQFIGEPDIENISEIPANISSQIRKSQGVIRVLAIGDSMTHCMEGDFTWRYRFGNGLEAKTWQWTF